MSIRAKIIVGITLIALIGLSLGVTGMLSIQTLTDMTDDLESMQTTSGNIVNVLNAHYVWRNGLTEAVLKGSSETFTGSLDPTACAFGTWAISHEAQSITDAEVLSLLAQIEEPHTFIHTEAAKVLSLMDEGRLEETQALLINDILPQVGTVTSLLTQVGERYDVLAGELSLEVDDVSALLNTLIIALITIALVLCVGVAVILTRWIVRKLHWYEDVLDNIPFPLSVTDNNRNWTFINRPVEGMLGAKRAEMLGKPCSKWGATICGTDNCGVNCLQRGQNSTTFDQTGANFKVDIAYLTDLKGRKIGHIEVVQDITAMVKTQRAGAALVENIEQVSRSFITGSSQIADGAQSLAQGSSQQAASVEQLSSSIAEIADKTKENAEMAGKAAALANTIKQNAEKGSAQMDDLTGAVREINTASQNISKVIKTIEDIAFQTNILALNASVEAARAGQHGKGFAVVAEEVRNLATKSSDAAKDTGALIANSVEKAELGARIADETSASLTEIVAGINESSLIVTEIAKSSEEQSLGIAQINKGIDQVAQVVQQNSATAEQSAAASEEMSSQANTLEELLLQYNAENGTGLPENKQARLAAPKR